MDCNHSMQAVKIATEAAAMRVWAEGRMVYLELVDGRVVGFPANRFRILSRASDEQLRAVRIAVGRIRRSPYGLRRGCPPIPVAAPAIAASTFFRSSVAIIGRPIPQETRTGVAVK